MNSMRHAMEEARDALQTAISRDRDGLLLGGIAQRGCEAAIESIAKALSDDEDDEANAQRKRDECIGAHGYDITRIGSQS